MEGSDFLRPKPLLFLAYLAVEGPRERRHLREVFWPGVADAGLNLRVLLSQTRSALPGVLVEDEHRLGLGVPSDVADLLAACKTRSKDILTLYPGAFLEQLTVADLGADLEEWMLLTREFVACQVRTHLILEAESMAAAGNLTPAAALAEKAWRLKGAPPIEMDDMQRLHQLLSAARHGSTALLRKEIRELGRERQQIPDRIGLKSIQQVGGARIRTALPKLANAFVGRTTELDDLHQLLMDPEVRLLTLVGPGGIGKTRIALEIGHTSPAEKVYFVALDSTRHPAEVPVSIARALGVDLAGAEDPLEALRRTIGAEGVLLILDNFEHLIPAHTTVSSLLDTCPALNVLVTSRERLNLDWESVYPLSGLDTRADEQGDAVRLFVNRARKADGRFRVTSDSKSSVMEICRQVGGSPLGIELAAAWVRTLSIEQISVELARDIELLEWQPDGSQDRHRNLRSIFDYAWGRLSEGLQQLLTGLTVFDDGFTREGAAAVLNATLPRLLALVDASLLRVTELGRYDLHPLLCFYIRRKLVEDPTRRMYLQERHARYFAGQGEEAWNAFDHGQNHGLWTTWEKTEYSNVEAALEWSQQHLQVELALRLCRIQTHEWVNRGQFKEGSERLLALLSRASDLVGTAAYRWALVTVCHLRQRLDPQEWSADDRERLDVTLTLMQEAGDTVGMFRVLNMKAINIATEHGMERSLVHFHEALHVAQQGNFLPGQIAALTNLSIIEMTDLNLSSARAYLTHAIEMSTRSSLELNEIIALMRLGQLETLSGNYETAIGHLDRGFNISTALGQQFFSKGIAYNMGETVFFRSMLTIARCNGDLESAQRWFERSKSFTDAPGLKVQTDAYMIGIGDILLARGNFTEAREYFEADLALAVAAQRRDNKEQSSSRIGLGNVEHEEGRYAEACEHFRFVLTKCPDTYTRFRGIESLAATLGKLGEHRRAVKLWAAAARFRQSKGLPLPPIFREQYEAALGETRSFIDENEFQEAWAEGERLSLERTIDVALGQDS